jgi:indole-3-glycerol phosphate synthase
MSVLAEICKKKRDHVSARESAVPLAEIKKRAAKAGPVRGFERALRGKKGPALITEIKKASPSGGVIRADFNPAKLAKAYEAGGAACLSVLTDEPYFQGHDDYLAQARNACALPVLRKDFMVDEYQIYESRALGADCVLLIMAALDDKTARLLYSTARALSLDVLVEVHDRPELDRAVALGATMIGVNSRNLKTLKVDLNTALTLAETIPASALRIAESGINDSADLKKLQAAGYRSFLIGESLMRQENVELAVKNILRT